MSDNLQGAVSMAECQVTSTPAGPVSYVQTYSVPLQGTHDGALTRPSRGPNDILEERL
jgi:hypothetical protein